MLLLIEIYRWFLLIVLVAGLGIWLSRLLWEIKVPGRRPTIDIVWNYLAHLFLGILIGLVTTHPELLPDPLTSGGWTANAQEHYECPGAQFDAHLPQLLPKREATLLRQVKFAGCEDLVPRRDLLFLTDRVLADTELHRKLLVEFSMESPPPGENSGCVNGRYKIHTRHIKIFLRCFRTAGGWFWKDVMRVFIHELDHFWWDLMDKEFDYDPPYRERPHEVHARQRAEHFLEVKIPEWVH